MDIDELLAREEIHDVLKRYVRGVDRRDRDLMASCYHPDGIDDHGNFVGPGDEFADFVTGDRGDQYVQTTHFLAAPNIVINGTVAAVDTYCMAYHLMQPMGTRQEFKELAVRYLDRFERRSGKWLIAHRRCIFDWSIIRDLDVEATALAATSNTARRDKNDDWYALLDAVRRVGG